MVIQDLDTGNLKSFCQFCVNPKTGKTEWKDFENEWTSITDGVRLLEEADELWAHNGIKYDYPLLRKLFPQWAPKGLLRDTLVCSRLIWADLSDRDAPTVKANKLPASLMGSHSLEAWGFRLGVLKGNYGKTNDFSKWSPEMQAYCEQDVRVLTAFVKLIDKRRAEWDWSESIDLEHDFAWIIEEMCQRGVGFDEQEAQKLTAELVQRKAQLTEEVQRVFPPTEIKLKTKIKHVPFNPGSRQQIADRLQKLGWVSTKHTPTGQPQIDEDVLGSLPYPEAKTLAEYFMVQKLLGQLAEGDNSWCKHAKDGRIHGGVNTNGAVTGRCTHSSPNLAQVPAVGRNPYGGRCRSLFRPEPPLVQVGADASGIELRCFAHYLAQYDNGEYGKVVCEGDVHTRNQLAFGLPEGKEHRPKAKNGIYALLYGAGDWKLGTTIWEPLGAPGKEAEAKAAGHKARSSFERKVPAYAKLIAGVRGAAKTRGFLRGMDGRKLYVRSEHSALNTLLQSCGALLVKKATVLAYPKWKAIGAHLVLHVHDEVQLEAPPDAAEAAGRAFVEALQEAGKSWGFKVPLSGEFKVGSSWKDTH